MGGRRVPYGVGRGVLDELKGVEIPPEEGKKYIHLEQDWDM